MAISGSNNFEMFSTDFPTLKKPDKDISSLYLLYTGSKTISTHDRIHLAVVSVFSEAERPDDVVEFVSGS